MDELNLKKSRTSKCFNAHDADIIIRSSDNVDFYVHKKNLEFSTGGFPPANLTSSNSNEVVALSESAATLEIMFQFVYPKRYPALHKLNFEALMLLAEAAEKYEVFALINSCEFYLRNFLNQHSLTILDFAARHDYRSIVEELAMILVDTPMTDLFDLPSTIFKPWVCWTTDCYMSFSNPINLT
ncbi:hypothetical protein DFH05DRAFT_211823 [Lentinula detonsa]|uniref:BTB domain-containing protein n=1 Tax=Lentinula detonsa TaxID=2804962 RepID=A0A9W8TW13_9AGAR|nr:hypothetical protein DFH05DRAFT_211823 [Lentinula detonsa]